MILDTSLPKKKPSPNFFLIFVLLLAAAGAYIPTGSSDIALPILLKEKNYSDTFIGIILGLHLISYSSACLLVPSFSKKFSCTKILYFTIANTLLSLLMFIFSNHPALFISYYILQGAFTAITIVILTDAIATISHPMANKGILMGIFVIMSSAGYFAGIVLTPQFHVASVNNFLLASCIFAACFLPLFCSNSFHFFIKQKIQEKLQSPINFYSSIKALKTIPIGLIAILIYGINDNVIDGLIPIWGMSHGMTIKESSSLSIPILVGGVILTPFLSLSFKFFGYRKAGLIYSFILILIFITAHILNLYYPKFAFISPHASLLVKTFHLHRPLMIIGGGIINVFETLYLCIIADHFEGALLTGVCSTSIFLSHISGAIACAMSGYVIAHNTYHHLGIFLILINSLLMIALFAQNFPKKNFA